MTAKSARPTIAYALCALVLLALSSGYASGREDGLLPAARDGNGKLARKLVKAGANVQQTGRQGETALHWAAFHGLHALASSLIERGASVNARVQNGNTPLHQAAYQGHLQIVELLVVHGATVTAVNERGLTATQWADRNGHNAVVGYLVAHGGVVAPHPDAGKAPASLAARASTDASTSAGQRRLTSYSPRVLLSRASRSGQSPTTSVHGMSARLGDLPPLVLKVPDSSPSLAPSLVLTPELEPPPGATTSRRAPTSPTPGVLNDPTWIQLGAFRVHEHAQIEWRNASSAHQELLADFAPTIIATQVDGNKTLHRLRIGPLPRGDARRLCAALGAQQRPCLLVSESGR